MPLGWAALFHAAASDYADLVTDGYQDPVFAAFRPLASALSEVGGDFQEELAIIEAQMESLPLRKTADMQAIQRVNSALVNPGIGTVTQLAEEVAMNVRSLERLAKRAFGFSPKLLLRRQRFCEAFLSLCLTLL